MTAPILEARPALRLRAPWPAFAALGLLTLYIVALPLAAWAGSGLVRFEFIAVQALAVPVALATALTALILERRLRMGLIANRFGLIWRAASAFGAMGFAWPLSFSASALLQGEVHAALVQAVASLATGLVGALIGAIAGVASAFLATSPPEKRA